MRIAWLCDFDGTISPSDIGAAFVQRFSPAGAVPELDGWLAGRVGHRELTRAQCERVRATREEALEFTRGFDIDPGFAAFALEAHARADAVMVVSEGFDFYVADALERAGLGWLPRAANQLDFRADRTVELRFPFAHEDCADCGNCKARHVREHGDRGYHTVLVGDGLSDRHGALAADRVLARGALREWCEAGSVAHDAFRDFADVIEHGRRPDRVAAAAAAREGTR